MEIKNEYNLDKLLIVSDEIFNKYSFLNCGKEQKLKIIKNIIDKINNKDDILYQDNLNKLLTSYLESYIIRNFNDKKKVISLLSKYLIALPMVNSYEDAIECLNKLRLFMNKYNYQLNKDVVKKLLIYSNKFSIIANYLTLDKNDNYLNNLINESNNELSCNENTSDNLGNSIDIYTQEINGISLLTIEEEEKLFSEYKNGNNAAKLKLIESNLRLVIFVARKYIGHGLAFEDLIQEGNLGLVEAVERYDQSKKCRFSTYACYWIKKYLARAIKSSGRVIRIPENIYDGMMKYKKAREELNIKLGRDITIDEVAKYMDIPLKNAIIFDNALSEPCSLNLIICDEDEIECLLPNNEVSIEDIIIEKDMKMNVEKMLGSGKLTDREREILYERFGFNGNEPKTLEEIGKKYGITRERVRQIETKIFTKLRHVRDINNYMVYLNNDESLNKIK